MYGSIELEASRSDLESAGDAVSKLPPGLVKRRMEAALKGVEAEIQSQLWGHLRSSSSKGTAGQPEGAATAAKVRTIKYAGAALRSHALTMPGHERERAGLNGSPFPLKGPLFWFLFLLRRCCRKCALSRSAPVLSSLIVGFSAFSYLLLLLMMVGWSW